MTNPKRITSFIHLALAQSIIGVNIVIAKFLLPVLPVYFLLSMRFFIGSFVLCLVCVVTKSNPTRDINGNRLSLKDWGSLVAQALCAGFLFNIFILSGLRYTDASTAGIITSITPAVIAILSYFILKEKPGPRRILAIFLAVIGLLVISIGKAGEGASHSSWLGDFLVVLALIPEALFTVIAKWHETKISSFSVALIINTINAFLFLPFAISTYEYIDPSLSYHHELMVVLYGTLGALFFVLWYKGLEKNTASVAAIFTALMPISTTVLAFYFLHEHISVYDITGIILVICSIILGSANFKTFEFKGFILND